MKKFIVFILCAVMMVAICFSGCGVAEIETETENNTQGTSMFVEIEHTNIYRIVYHKETKVMYAVSWGGYNAGNFALLVNADGTPMLWEG